MHKTPFSIKMVMQSFQWANYVMLIIIC